MKKKVQLLIIILFIFLSVTNVYIFFAGITSSNKLLKMEEKLKKLKEKNLQLESRLSRVDSLDYAASVAAQMDFNKKIVPTYLESLKYAFNR